MKQMQKISSQLCQVRDLTDKHMLLMKGDFKVGNKFGGGGGKTKRFNTCMWVQVVIWGILSGLYWSELYFAARTMWRDLHWSMNWNCLVTFHWPTWTPWTRVNYSDDIPRSTCTNRIWFVRHVTPTCTQLRDSCGRWRTFVMYKCTWARSTGNASLQCRIFTVGYKKGLRF